MLSEEASSAVPGQARRVSFDVATAQADPVRARFASWPQWLPANEPPRRTSLRTSAFAARVLVEGNTGQIQSSWPDADPVRSGGLSAKDAAMTMVINGVGVSVVLLPKIMADCGVILGILICVVCAKACHECGIMICGACFAAETLTGRKCSSYEDMVTAVAGPMWCRVLVISKNVAMMGFVIVYAQLLIDSFATFLSEESRKDGQVLLHLRFGLVFPIFGVLGMVTDLKQLSPFMSIGIVACFLKCWVIMAGGVWLTEEIKACPPEDLSILGNTNCRKYSLMPTVDHHELPELIGKNLAIILFSLAILSTVPSVRSQLEEPAQMHKVLSHSFIIIITLDLIIMILGYIGFGGTASTIPANENAIVGLTEWFPMLALTGSMSMIVNIMVSYPLFFFCVMQVFESSGNTVLHQPLEIPNIIFRLLLVLFLLSVGASLPYVGEMIGLMSSIFACCNNILFPVLFHMMSRGKTSTVPRHPRMRMVKYVGSTVLGIVVMIFGFKGSLQKLLAKMDAARETPVTVS